MKYVSGDSIYNQAKKSELLKSHDTSFRGLPDALIFGVRLCYNAPKHTYENVMSCVCAPPSHRYIVDLQCKQECNCEVASFYQLSWRNRYTTTYCLPHAQCFWNNRNWNLCPTLYPNLCFWSTSPVGSTTCSQAFPFDHLQIKNWTDGRPGKEANHGVCGHKCTTM